MQRFELVVIGGIIATLAAIALPLVTTYTALALDGEPVRRAMYGMAKHFLGEGGKKRSI